MCRQMKAETVTAALRATRFAFANERDLQDGIAQAFDYFGVQFTREVEIATGDRIDFLIGTIGVEVKIGGSLANFTRQLHRYAQSDDISALVVVTGRRRLEGLPETLAGKPIHIVGLWGDAL